MENDISINAHSDADITAGNLVASSEVPVKTAALKDEVLDDEKVTMDHFRSEAGVDDENIRWTMYYYGEYRIATKEKLNGLMAPEPVVKLILDTVVSLPVAVRTIDDAIKIINIIEGR